MTTARQIARAWNSVRMEFDTRVSLDKSCFEVYRCNPDLPLCDGNECGRKHKPNPLVLATSADHIVAERKAREFENEARGAAVLRMLRRRAGK